MKKVMFVCLGNICRSPMAEFIFSDMVKKAGREKDFEISSAATSSEALGCGVHKGTVKKLEDEGISHWTRYAVKLKSDDYNKYDYFIGMDLANIRDMKRIFAGDSQNKVYRLLDFSPNHRDIADPWYTGKFDATYDDIVYGLKYLLEKIQGDIE